MYVSALKTPLITPQDDLFTIFDTYLPSLENRDVVVITSKILSVLEGRIISKAQITKKALVQQEADAYLDLEAPHTLTIKNGILIPCAGIDESNCQEGYILYPQNAQKSAEQIWDYLRATRSLSQLGVLITDSHTTPMRYGVTGIALGWCGFLPHHSYIGKPDLFGNPLKVTVCNLTDALATSAVLVMGEADECTPLALIKEAPKLSFTDRPPTKEELSSLKIAQDDDIYAPLLKSVPWHLKGVVV